MTTRTVGQVDMSIGMFEDEPQHHIVRYKPASDEAINAIMKADEKSMDGRSNWLWFRLPNGDLIFGCFPEGDTYSSMEHETCF